MYVTLWEFSVRHESVRAFEALYGPDGAWVALFRTAPGYLGTELLCDNATIARYVTIDRWTSVAAYEAFRDAHRAEYEAIDDGGEILTTAERALGEFSVLA